MKRLLLLTLIVSLSITNVFAQTKISSRLMNAMNQALEDNAPVRALVLINDQVDIQSLDQELYARKADPQDRAYTVITTLKAKADETQPAVISSLNDRSSSEVLTIERFWVANMLLVEAIPSVLVELSQRSDVAYLDLDVQLDWDRPVAKSAAPIESPNGIEPGLAAINAPAMWRAGYTGAGTIVMNIDTGVDGNHVALASRWRGNDPGVPASAAWFEPGGSSTFPYDSDTHGTHTMGIMTGLATATHDTVGVAPGAKWIAANTFTAFNFTSANIASYQWAMDPDGNPMTTEDMPVAIGCSWTDPSGGDCATSSYYQIFQTVEAAGIAIVFSAGNSGSGASTITVPKNTNINLVNVWATGAIDGNTPSFPIADFSSRGPSTCGGTGSLLIKPEACAPGVYVRSSTPSNTYAYYDGTSMACPHVVGALALLKEAIPSKTGYELKMALYQTAVDLGTPGEDNDYGMGIIDVYAAYLALIDLLDPKPPVNFTAYSDYLTPSSMLLSWEDPTNFENGDTLLTSQFTIEVERDDGFIASVPGGSETYTDNGLTDGQLYNYTIYAKVITNDSTSFEVETSWYAGGSPFPAPPENLAVVGTTTDATLTWTDPTTQADGTPLDDLAEIRIYRNGTYIATVAPGVQTYLDTPPAGFFYTYTVRAVDNETPENLSVPSNEVGVFVGTTPNFLVWVHPDVAAATASQASGDSIFAALVANGESAFLTDNLFEFGTDLSIYEGIFVVLGIYSNNGVISSSDPEGPALDTYLQNGGHVYLEGGDCFNYDPDVGGYNIRPWFDLNDGADGSGDLIGVIGLNDLSAFTFSYSGDNNYMDELMPIASTPVWQNNANTDISGVFSVGYGSGRAIGVVPSFGGFVNSLEALYPDKRLASYEVSEMKVPSTVGKARIYRERNSLFVKKAAYYPELKKNRDINEQYFKFSGGGVGIEANNKVDLMAAYLGLFRNVGNPQLTLTPTAFSDTLLIGGTVDETLNLTNTGGSLAGDLNFTIAENPAVDWLTVAPTTGTISANQSLEATLTFSAVGLSSGLYSTTLEVTSNDPVNPLQIVNVDLYVNQPPVVGFSPDSMQITLNPGELDSLQMTITNSGLGPLVFQLSTIAGADESVNSGLNIVKLSPPFFLPVNPQKKLTAAGTSSIKASERASSYSTPIYMNPQEAIWDIQFFFDASAASGALGNAGAEFDGNYYYTTRWASNLIHKYDQTGNLVEEFSISGVTGLRDLASDGTYLYGGAAANIIYQMDFISHTLIGTISSPVAVRNIAYDEDNDAFWVGDWGTDLVLVSRTGSTLATIPAGSHGLSSMYGSAYDNVSSGGPFLWIFDQGGSGAVIHQLQLPAGTPTGVTRDVVADFPQVATTGSAGGLFTATGVVSGTFSIGGLMQSESPEPNILFVYELAPYSSWLSVGTTSGIIPSGGSENVWVRFNSTGLLGGNHYGAVMISSNDPVTPDTSMNVRLNVAGLQVMSVSPDSLEFDPILVGLSESLPIEVSNLGNFPLTISGISSTNPAFSPDLTAFVVQPFNSQTVTITFAPTVSGLMTGYILVQGDDPANTEDTVYVQGMAMEPPVVGFSPDSLQFSLDPAQIDSLPMTITNSGNGPLDFTLSDEDLLVEYIVKKKPDLSYLRDEFNVELSKDQDDWRRGTPQTEGAGGPDLYGYTWIDSDEPGGPVPNYLDISGTGTILTLSSMDDGTALLTLPFSVEFYGQSYNEVRVGSNGWISFTTSYTASGITNTQIPSATDPDNLIAILWDDLNGNNTNSHVYYQQIGNKFIIQFHNWNRYGHTGGDLNFQYVLYQDNETIELQYATMNFGTGSNSTSHTIGIENIDGSDGLEVVFNAAYVHNDMAIKFVTESIWVSENPTSGTVAPGGSFDVQVIVNSTGLLGGVHRANVIISSNDPVTPETSMPVRLTVSGIPNISLSPDQLTFDTLLVGATQDLTFEVANTGTFPLNVTGITATDAAFSANPTAFAVAPYAAHTVTVTFAPLSAGSYDAWVVVASDDPDSPLDSVQVTGVVNEAPVVSISPDSLHFDLNTGEVDSQVVVISNLGAGPLTFDLTDEDILGENVSLKMVDRSYIRPEYNVEIPKDQPDWRRGTPQTEGSGGPDLYGYTWIDSDEPGGPVFNWIDISATGTEITGLADDNYVGPFPIGFTFNFYGNDYIEFYVQSNGLVNFDNSEISLSNYQIPSADSYNNLIAWLWDDLDPGNALTHVYYQTMGNMLVIQFAHYFEYPDGGAWVDAEMILYSNGNIKIQYDYFDPAFDLLGCTVGIENIDGTDGLQVAYNGAYLHDDLALLFSLESQWLSENPSGGTIPAGGNMNIQVIANASGMFGGDYLATVVVNSNDPVNPVVELPRVSLTVTGVPVISTTPASLTFDSTFVGLTPDQELLVSNAGTDQLIINNITSTSPIFSVDTTHFELDPLSNMPVTVTFAPLLPGMYEGWLIIESNAPGNPLDSTHVMGVGIEAPVCVIGPNFQNPVFVPPGDSVEITINMANAGGSNLMWSASTTWQPMVLEKKVQPPVYGPREPLLYAEAAPSSSRPSRRSIEAIWDLQFSFDVQIASGDLGNAGSEFDGNYYYTTRWASNLLHKYDMTGNLLEEFSIPGVSALRDLAFDGTYMYGGAAANTIYIMDFVNKTLIGTITSPVAVRNIAYDSDSDGFWVGDWGTDLVLVSRTGVTLATITAATHSLGSMYGSAYDNWSDGGPYLWIFDQGALGDAAVIYQLSVTSGTLTGISHDVSLDFPASLGIAGGLFTAEGIIPGKVSLGGLLQGTPDMFFVYELTEGGPSWMKLMMTSGMVSPGDNSDMPIRIYGIEEGSDTAFVVIRTNDPAAPVVNIEVHKSMVTGIEDLAQLPTTFDISQNYPNPFNPTTTIKYQLPKMSDVKLVIYNVLGQQVRSLLNGQIEAGYHSIVWDGRNEAGRAVASGIYIYRFEAGDFQKTMKLMLLK